MKKFRGKKRYFKNLWVETNIEYYDLNFEDGCWFDSWHTHLDFYGLGNSSSSLRREHIKAHMVLYKNILEKIQILDMPYQSWIELVDKDTEQDAVYLHTANPTSDNFPLKINNLTWDVPVPDYLKDLLDLNEFNIGQYKEGRNSYFIIQSKKMDNNYSLT